MNFDEKVNKYFVYSIKLKNLKFFTYGCVFTQRAAKFRLGWKRQTLQLITRQNKLQQQKSEYQRMLNKEIQTGFKNFVTSLRFKNFQLNLKISKFGKKIRLKCQNNKNIQI